MTYGLFLTIFLVVPLMILLVLARRRLSGRLWLTLFGVSLLALVYTAPWDNLIIVNGVWSYSRPRITGLLIGHVPLEECGFYVLQVFLTGLLTAEVIDRIRS